MNILVVGPSWVGDMVMSQSLLLRLKQDNPNCQIDVLAPDWCRPVLARMPQVHKAIAMPVGHGALQWSVRKKVAAQLTANNYQQSIILPNSLKSALVPWMAKIPRRIGWRGEMRYGLLNDMRRLDPQAFPLMVQRYIALAEPTKQSATQLKALIKPTLQIDRDQQLAMIEKYALASEGAIAFCPGAEFGPAKRWPHYHFATLASSLIAVGKQVVCLGSAKDTAAIMQIKDLLSEAEQRSFVDLSGRTDLTQAIDILDQCAAIVSNDSGLMHIGAAVNTPMLALYGPTSPDFTPPLSDSAEVIRLIEGYLKLRRTNTEQGYHQSMIDIQPQRVFDRLQQMVAN
ncbi:MAG: ADP-heptose--LPS heptosyltransferase II [Osedax symbiont Rs2]|nr:MAG: ADP-heptose--LPS heptosyltransferase II [Osedax symbiont Rs2]